VTEQQLNVEETFARAESSFSQRRFAEAKSDYEKLIGFVEPANLLFIRLAESCKGLKQFEQAADYYCDAIKADPANSAAYLPAFNLLERMDQLERASEIVADGLVSMPGHPDLKYLSGKLEYRNNRHTEAEELYRQAIEAGPDPRALHFIMSEYATIKDRLQKYDEAMDACNEAQRLASQVPGVEEINRNLSLEIIEKSRRWFAASDVSDWRETSFEGRKAPVFLVGFPRSGTTLMEEVLVAHPDLSVTDEVQTLQAKLHFISEILGREIEFPEGLGSLSHKEIQTWRDEYFAGMERALPGTDTGLRIVDKYPTTFYYLGVIKRFFPEAPVVMMIRDPRDVCLSCFFQTFAPNPDTINFDTLEDTTDYYVRTMSLYLQLRDALGLNILEVKYEDLCADFEAQTRKVIQHIDERWNDSLLHYRENSKRDYVQTPSYAAVREPISEKAIGRWRNYEKHLAPVLQKLQPFVGEFGYG
jgi:hypothetical protein